MNNALKILFICFAVLAGCSDSCEAQKMNIDSLLQVLSQMKDDTNKVMVLIQAGNEYEYSQPDSAIICYRRARDLSQSLGYTRGKIHYMLNRQHIMAVQGQTDSAKALCQEAISLSERIQDRTLLASALGNLGNVYLHIGDKQKAIDYYLRCATILDQLGNKRKLAALYANLCINYQRLKQYEHSLLYGEKAIQLAREVNSKQDLGVALTNYSATLIDMNNRAAALPHLEEALAISRDLTFDRLQLSVLVNLAATLENVPSQREKYKRYIDDALKLSRALDEKTGLAVSLRCLADYFFHESQYDRALIYALQSLDITRRFSNPEDEAKVLALLSYIAVATGDMNGYHVYRMQSDTLRNSLINKDLAKNIQELEQKYESDKKEIRIAQLQQLGKMQTASLRQKNTLNAILAGLVLVILIATVVFVRYYRQRQLLQQQTIRELQTERQLLATDAVLQGQEVERSRLARDLHDGLGGILSGAKFTFDAMKDNIVMTPEHQRVFARGMDLLETSIRELRRVSHNMMPESLLKTGLQEAVKDLCNDLELSNVDVIYQEYGLDGVTFNKTGTITVYRIIQELLSNAIRHADASQIIVQLSCHDNRLQLTVEDNGKGFDREHVALSKGMGWSNIQSRVDYLKGTLDIKSIPGSGTSVTITLPNLIE